MPNKKAGTTFLIAEKGDSEESDFIVRRFGVTVNLRNGKPEQVKIGGRAVIVFKTEFQI